MCENSHEDVVNCYTSIESFFVVVVGENCFILSIFNNHFSF